MSTSEIERTDETTGGDSALDGGAAPEEAPATRRKSWYFLEWNEPLRQFLLALPQDEFVDILLGLGSDPLDFALQQLGLSQAWKKATSIKLKKRDAMLFIYERARRALRDYKGSTVIGSGLVLTWWGRRAVAELKGTELEALLNAQKVGYRFTFADAWLREAGERAAPIHEILLRLRESKQVMDRAFAGLMLSAQAGVGSNALATSVSEWMGGTQRLTAAPEDPPRAEHAEAAPSAGSLEPDEPETPPPAPPPEPPRLTPPPSENPPAPAPRAPDAGPAPQPRNQPAPSEEQPLPPPPAALMALPPVLAQLREKVGEAHREMREVQQCLVELRFDEVTTRTNHLKQLQGQVEQGIASLWARLSENGEEPSHPIPRQVFQESRAADEYFLALSEQLRQMEQRSAEAFERSRNALRSEIQQLRLPVPEELEQLNGHEALRALSESLRPLLQQERACQCLLQAGVDPESVGIPPEQRLAFYRRRAALPDADAATLLAALNQDPRALAHEPGEGCSLVAMLIRALVEAMKPLPAETWQTLGRLREGMSAVELLTGLELLDHVEIADTELIDLKGLQELVGDECQKLPEQLRYKLARFELLSLPIQERIPRLAALALEDGLDETTLQELLTALATSGRHAETVALAVLAAHASRLKDGARHLRNSLLATLVQLATRPDRHDIVRIFLQDASWLAHEPDDVAVLLHLSMATHYPGPYENLRFQEPEALQTAERARPVLVGRCMLPEAKAGGVPLDHAERERALRAGRQALHEWDHDLQKRTCYVSFDSAVDYQDYFRARLEQAFEQLEPREPLPEFDPVALVEEARVAKNLPRVDGPVLDSMTGYLRKQLRRLEQLHAAADHLGGEPLREALAREEPDLRTSLESEARQTPGAPAVQLIYRQVLGRL